MIEMDEREKARFWTKVEDTRTCWNWRSSFSRNGYGVFGFKGKSLKAHRVAYELVNGKIPQGLNVLHTCDNPKCINPDHLWVGTQGDNVVDICKKKRFRLGKYSQYRGVKFRPEVKKDTSCKWTAYVSIKDKVKNLGSYKTEEEAARAVDKYKIEKLGINYGLNFEKEVDCAQQ